MNLEQIVPKAPVQPKVKATMKRRRGDRQRAARQQNCSTVEKKGNHITGDVSDQAKRMTAMFGNTHLPPVVYKGNFIPLRILSEFSFLTAG